MTDKVLDAATPLGAVTENIAAMLLANCDCYGSSQAVSQRTAGGAFQSLDWRTFVERVGAVAGFLKELDIAPQQRVAVWCGNSTERLVTELGVMASGRVSVPIFPGYPPEFVGQLLEFSKISALVVDTKARLESLPPGVLPKHLIVLQGAELEKSEGSSLNWYSEIVSEARARRGREEIAALALQVVASELAVIMFTSGTTSFPKGVMLTHTNILSQQTALRQLWNPEPGMRFLSYLPWHHSFGGLFERFFALSTAGCIAIDDSMGKNIERMLQNFKEVRPHVFFSVPKVYAELISRILSSPDSERDFFHEDLRFVFTAAAPLPINISNVFKRKGVPVLEGWGLTETSPCCTLTAMSLERQPGVVGFPIPGVSLKVGDDGEILVRGANVMKGYFDRPDATAAAFEDGWFKTGDVGELTEAGLKIVSRKDRIFKLGNGEKVFPTPIEDGISTTCRYVKHVYIFGSGQDAPLALLFPNYELLESTTVRAEDAHCERPRELDQLATCLTECMDCLNRGCGTKINRVTRALVIDRELTVDRQELTPSFKLIPRSIESQFGTYMRCLETGNWGELPGDAQLIDLKESMTAKVTAGAPHPSARAPIQTTGVPHPSAGASIQSGGAPHPSAGASVQTPKEKK
jgi:long-subunit acyl-CoA synthetase (AMP-forming)